MKCNTVTRKLVKKHIFCVVFFLCLYWINENNVFIQFKKCMNGNVFVFHVFNKYTAQKNKKEHFENTLNLNWEEYQAGYLYWNGLGNVFRTKGCHIVWWKLKWPTYRGLNSKTPRKSKWKKLCSRLVHLLKFHCSYSKWYSVVCMPPTCLCACLTSGHAPNEMTDGVLGWSGPEHHWAPGKSKVQPCSET